MRRDWKVFISSTYEDLKEYRQRAIEVVNRYECIPLAKDCLCVIVDKTAQWPFR